MYPQIFLDPSVQNQRSSTLYIYRDIIAIASSEGILVVNKHLGGDTYDIIAQIKLAFYPFNASRNNQK